MRTALPLHRLEKFSPAKYKGALPPPLVHRAAAAWQGAGK